MVVRPHTTDTSYLPSNLNFFDLPYPVRKRVYQYANITGNVVDLNLANLEVWTKRGTKRDPYEAGKMCYCCHDLPMPLLQRTRVFPSAGIFEDEDDEEVWQFCERSGNWWNHTPHPLSWTYFEFDRPYRLLLVSKQVHAEVKPLIYGENKFRICQGNPYGLSRLCELQGTTLSLLTSLSLRLSATSMVDEYGTPSVGWDYHSSLLLDLIDSPKLSGRLARKEWTRLIRRLTRSIQPGQLKFYVTLSASEDNVEAVLRTMKELPRLRDCGILWIPPRRARKVGVELTDCPGWETKTAYKDTRTSKSKCAYMINQLVMALTTSSEPAPTPFRFLDLPKEIRLQILEHTDLPLGEEVQWRPRKSEPPIHKPEILPRDALNNSTEEVASAVDHAGSGVVNYEKFEFSVVTERSQDIDECEVEEWEEGGLVECCLKCGPQPRHGPCYCTRRGYVQSTTCRCRNIRHPLFSVSRQVRADVIALYYLKNRFLVTPYGGPSRLGLRGFSMMPQIELSLYLSSLAHTALQYIRWLEWLIPDCRENYLRPNTPAWYDYLDTIIMMEHGMNIPNLTLVVNLSFTDFPDRWHEGEYSWDPTVKWETWCENLVGPLERLGAAGLKDFFVYLQKYFPEEDRIAQERHLERIVMGPEYNSKRIH